MQLSLCPLAQPARWHSREQYLTRLHLGVARCDMSAAENQESAVAKLRR